MPDNGSAPPTSLDAIHHLLAEVRRLDLLLFLHLREGGRLDAPSGVVPEVGRNDPCPCGSGKKYKKCHGAGK